MRPPAKIKPWLTDEKMFAWAQAAGKLSEKKRREAILLTHSRKLHAFEVAKTLGVSLYTVRLWISQYNRLGPKGLERAGRGGRRWAFLTHAQEAEILKPYIHQARLGKPPRAKTIKEALEKQLGKKISLPYVYRLLGRHNWSRIIAQSRLKRTGPDNFRKYAQPWKING